MVVGHVATRKATMDSLPIIDAHNKVRDYNRNYRLTHPEIYVAAMKRNNTILARRRREDPEVREKYLEEHKIYNDTHKEQRNAYKRAYRARMRLERKAEFERAAEEGGGA